MNDLIIKAEIWTIKCSGINNLVAKLGGRVIDGDNFEYLNHQLAEVCDKLLIVEAGEKSGTILVAKEFVDNNKEVWCVPGRIDDPGSMGCNQLIASGAMMYQKVTDLI